MMPIMLNYARGVGSVAGSGQIIGVLRAERDLNPRPFGLVRSRSVLVSDWFVMQQVTLDDHFSGTHMCLLYSEWLSIPHTILHTNDHTYNSTYNWPSHTILHTNASMLKLCSIMLNYAVYANRCSRDAKFMLKYAQFRKLCLMLRQCDYAKKQC